MLGVNSILLPEWKSHLLILMFIVLTLTFLSCFISSIMVITMSYVVNLTIHFFCRTRKIRESGNYPLSCIMRGKSVSESVLHMKNS
jgi:hypothetical protein